MTEEDISSQPAGEPGATGSTPGTGPSDGTTFGYGTHQATFPLYRAREGQILGGVAAGLARYLDLDVSLVRIVIVVLALIGGVGVPLYLAAWLLIPEEGTSRSVLADLLHPQAAL